ncbi:hypothetical protein VTN96DRAFT_9149 [Rasamsonia emersonii]
MERSATQPCRSQVDCEETKAHLAEKAWLGISEDGSSAIVDPAGTEKKPPLRDSAAQGRSADWLIRP